MNRNRGGQKLKPSDIEATRNKSDRNRFNIENHLMFVEFHVSSNFMQVQVICCKNLAILSFELSCLANCFSSEDFAHTENSDIYESYSVEYLCL